MLLRSFGGVLNRVHTSEEALEAVLAAGAVPEGSFTVHKYNEHLSKVAQVRSSLSAGDMLKDIPETAAKGLMRSSVRSDIGGLTTAIDDASGPMGGLLGRIPVGTSTIQTASGRNVPASME